MIQIALNDAGDINNLTSMVSGLLLSGLKINIYISSDEQNSVETVIEATQQNETFETIQTVDIEKAISDILWEIGIPSNISGYRYIKYAIKMVITNQEGIGSVTKLIYPEIACKFNTTPSRVERAIRHAIEVAWGRNAESNNKLFGNTINLKVGRPTNSEFIALVSDKIRLGILT